MNKALVIGIGNQYRGDDAAGLEVACSLEKQLGSLVDVAYCDGDEMELMDLWLDRKSVFLIDAVSSDEEEVGFLHRFLAHEQEIPAIFSQSSTHLLGIAHVIELAKALQQLPEQLFIYGIEGKHYSIETKISEELKAKLTEIAKKIEMDIREQLRS